MWKELPEGLFREVKFSNFAEALEFVNNVGKLAEKANHHPDIEFGWGYARLTLMDHEAKAITEKDRSLAAEIEVLINKT